MSSADLDFRDNNQTDNGAWMKIMQEKEAQIRADERQKILDKINSEAAKTGLGFVQYQVLRWLINNDW